MDKGLDCQRFHRCPIFGPGCEMEIAERDCGVLSSVKEELSRFGGEIKAVLEEKQLFSYEEDWYQKLRKELLRGGLIKEKDLQEVEDRAVAEFLRKKREAH